MSVLAIAYISELAEGVAGDAIAQFVRRASAFNAQAGVTGILLFDGTRFLQYIEGPEDGVHAAYGRITGSKLHTKIIELGRADVGRRFFPYWGMRMLPAQAEQLKAAMFHDWSSLEVRTTVPDGQLRGLEHVAQIVAPHIGAGAPHAALGI